jgi:hypothetical protein
MTGLPEDKSSQLLESREPERSAARRRPPPWDLLVMSRETLRLVHLPGRGAVVVGRTAPATVVVDDPEVSPLHLRLAIGPRFTVEDLGSERGTWMWDTRVAPGRPHAFLPGQPIAIGSTVLMLSGRQRSPRLRRLWTEGELASLLDDECVRSRRTGAQFAWALIDVTAGEPLAGDGPLTLDLLTRLDQTLPPPHLLGRLRPRQLAALLVGAPGPQIEAQLRQLDLSLRLGGYLPRIGVAFFPEDGLAGPALWHRAERRARALFRLDAGDHAFRGSSWCHPPASTHTYTHRVSSPTSIIFVPDPQLD